MSDKDYNKIAAIEKAIKDKYGDDAIANPKAFGAGFEGFVIGHRRHGLTFLIRAAAPMHFERRNSVQEFPAGDSAVLRLHGVTPAQMMQSFR